MTREKPDVNEPKRHARTLHRTKYESKFGINGGRHVRPCDKCTCHGDKCDFGAHLSRKTFAKLLKKHFFCHSKLTFSFPILFLLQQMTFKTNFFLSYFSFTTTIDMQKNLFISYFIFYYLKQLASI
jgi:hypothetical protein